jgi:hypothetical protein
MRLAAWGCVQAGVIASSYRVGAVAVTREYLGGYYIVECDDLEEALRQAARVPLARYGSVEIRPIVDLHAGGPSGASGQA